MVVLSTIVVAFMQSMSVERSVAKSVNNTNQATFLAEGAMDVAMQRIQSISKTGPYAAIFDQDTNGSPYLYLAKRELTASNMVTRRIPLFSTLTPISNFDNLSQKQIDSAAQTIADLDNAGAAISRNVTMPSDLVYNMNSRSLTFTNGLVGLTSGSAPRALPVNWIYVRDSAGRVVGRYAFWTDDECSKIDLRVAGQVANSTGSHARGAGTNASDISLLSLTNSPTGAGSSSIANLLALRNLTNIAEQASFVQYTLPGGGTVVTPSSWERLRPYVTVYSLHDDRSPDGKRKLDLNAVVSGTNTAAQIQKEVFAIRDAITNNLPGFGLRYYSLPSTPTPGDQQIYATKIAANIRDFIDTNNIASVIQSDGTAHATNSPGFIPYETLNSDLPFAFGKESGPFLSEYFRVVRVISPAVHPVAADTVPIPLVIRFAHYVELHNPSGKTITAADLGPSPYVMVANRRVWNNTSLGGNPSVLRPADIKISLPSNFSIAPNGFAVLTTDGEFPRDSQADFIGSATNRYVINKGTGPGTWELVDAGGKADTVGGLYEDYAVTAAPTSNDRYGLQNSGSSSPSYAEQRERLLFGNNDGLIDYTLRIFTDRGNYIGRNVRNPTWNCTYLADDNTSSKNAPGDSSSAARFTRGDVRSNTEASSILASTTACWKEGNAGGYGNTLNSPTGSGGPQQTLGSVNFNTDQNRTGVALWRQGWYEYTADPAGNHFVASKALGSLGELGAVYDPARYDIGGYRSQGATLRIGHSDSGTNNRANSTGADYMNWLGGRGTDDATSTNYAKNAFLLLDVFRTDGETYGRINPNSLVRDSTGMAFRSVLDRYTFESASTNQASAILSGLALNATNTISALQSFATNTSNGFLVSVGDLSRSPVFSTTNTALAGVSMLGVSDAGREEFLRRSSDLLSTQSLAFTVFLRAEAGGFVRDLSGVDRFRMKAAATREIVVQLRPEYAPASDPTVPATPTSWSVITPKSLTY